MRGGYAGVCPRRGRMTPFGSATSVCTRRLHVRLKTLHLVEPLLSENGAWRPDALGYSKVPLDPLPLYPSAQTAPLELIRAPMGHLNAVSQFGHPLQQAFAMPGPSRGPVWRNEGRRLAPHLHGPLKPNNHSPPFSPSNLAMFLIPVTFALFSSNVVARLSIHVPLHSSLRVPP
jgi:hypothetical protein